MRNRLLSLVTLFLSLSVATAVSASPPPKAGLPLQQELASGSALVTDQNTGKVLYSRNPDPSTGALALLGIAAIAVAIWGLVGTPERPVHQDPSRGLDHGAYVPLTVMYPDADIPVVQLSLRSDLDPRAHIEAGHALQALRGEDVLIVGSGMSFHNMRGYGDPRFAPISDEFDHWLTAAVELPPGERDRALQRWEDAPAARLCHPPRAEEHLIPLLVAAGAAGDSNGSKVFSDRVMHTTLSAYRFG